MADHEITDDIAAATLPKRGNKKRSIQGPLEIDREYSVPEEPVKVDYDEEWLSPMCLFPMHVGPLCAISNEKTEMDICAFIADKPEPGNTTSIYAYFDHSLFAPPKPDSLDDKSSHECLRAALFNAARENGFQLILNGDAYEKKAAGRKCYPFQSGPPLGSRAFTCARYRTYRTNRTNRVAEPGPRKRHRTTKRPMSQEHTCSFRFNVFFDRYGYYIKQGSGNMKHCHHA